MTPLQRYRSKLAEQLVEVTMKEARRHRRIKFAKVRILLQIQQTPCPTDDDAMQKWMLEAAGVSWGDIIVQPVKSNGE